MTNRIVSILFSFIWTIQVFAPFVCYEWGRWKCGEEFSLARDGADIKEIQTIFFPKGSQVAWEKKNREFQLNGKLYDVISIEKRSDGITISCVADAREAGIVSGYCKCFSAEKNKDGSKSGISLVKIKCLAPQLPLMGFHAIYRPGYIITNATLFLNRLVEKPYPPPDNYYYNTCLVT